MDTPRPLIDHILVGVDAEGLAGHAVRVAAQLAAALGCGFECAHGVQHARPLWGGAGEERLAELRASQLAAARARCAAALEELGLDRDPSELLHVASGPPHDVLLERAEASDAGLIVLGPHADRSALDFGSTARAVLARTERPVWVQPHAPGAVERILVPVDFSDPSRCALEHAVGLARHLGAAVHIVHGYELPIFAYAEDAANVPGIAYVVEGERDEARRRLEAWASDLAGSDVPVSSAVLEGELQRELLAATNQHDLVVMGTRGRTGLPRFLLGSVAYSMLRRADVPVLVVSDAESTWALD